MLKRKRASDAKQCDAVTKMVTWRSQAAVAYMALVVVRVASRHVSWWRARGCPIVLLHLTKRVRARVRRSVCGGATRRCGRGMGYSTYQKDVS